MDGQDIGPGLMDFMSMHTTFALGYLGVYFGLFLHTFYPTHIFRKTRTMGWNWDFGRSTRDTMERFLEVPVENVGDWQDSRTVRWIRLDGSHLHPHDIRSWRGVSFRFRPLTYHIPTSHITG